MYRMPRARAILVVEDFEPFRSFLCRTLEQNREFQIVQASDGLEAVHKAQAVSPDLIVIDIGLPKLNGIEAARQIRTLMPHTPILFLSQEKDSGVVQETFRLGARGYIHKPFALSHLLPAIDVVFSGGRFLSNNLEFTDTDSRHRHEAQFYIDDSDFLSRSTCFIANALRTADATIALATRSHLESIVGHLSVEGPDLSHATGSGTYIALDAAATLLTIMVDGMPDPELFSATLSGQIEAISKTVRKKHPRVAIFGECVGLLCAEGNAEAALILERIGNNLAETYDLDILCAYPMPQTHRNNGALKTICAEHTAVYWP
jgi:DNA-binding NarL/FixJ family response regulator